MTTGMASQTYVSSSATNDEVKHRILNVYAKFVYDVEPDRLFDWLVQEQVITIEQKQRICCKNLIALDRCRAILDHLFSIKHPRAFLVVRQALVKDNHYLLKDIDSQEPECGIHVQPEDQSGLHAKIQGLENDLTLYRSVKAQLRKNKGILEQRVHQLESKLRSEKKSSQLERRAWKVERDCLLKKQNELEKRLHTENLQSGYEPESNPVLVWTIKTRASREEKEINGFTILDKELFVANSQSSEVEVYDTMKLSFIRRWNLKQLNDPWDIVSCNRDKCLYVIDFKSPGNSNEILRVDPNGQLIKHWSTGSDIGLSLSTTYQSTVILAVFNRHKLNEYSRDGLLVREVILSSDTRMLYPTHAIKLANGHYLVGHGFTKIDRLRVWLVDAHGHQKKSFDIGCASFIEQLYYPFHLSVDRNGFVLVADRNNGRVLLLDSDLEFRREILSEEKDKLQGPSRILLDESNGQLILADNNVMLGEGHILFFDYK